MAIDDKSQTGINSKDIDDVNRAVGVLKGMFKGLKPDDILQVAKAFETVGMSFENLDPKNVDEIVKVFEKIGDKKYGVEASKNADTMIKSLDKMLQEGKIKNNAFVSATIRRTEIELQMAKLAKEKVSAQEKGGLDLITAQYKEQAMKVGTFAKEHLGADSDLTKNILANAGWIGLIVGLLVLVANEAKKFTKSLVDSAPALAQTGLMTRMAFGEATAVAGDLTAKIYGQATAGITAKQATQMYSEALKDHVVALGITGAKQTGADMETNAGREKAILLSYDLTFELNRMSYAMTGSTSSAGKLTEIANKLNMASTKAIQQLGARIATMAQTSETEMPTMIDLWDAMSDKMSAFKDSMGGSMDYLTEFSKVLGKLSHNAEISNYSFQKMAQGIVNMTKNTDPFMYMAMTGKGGKSFGDKYMDTIKKNPVERSMVIAEDLLKKFESRGKDQVAFASIAAKQMNLLGGMDEGTSFQFLNAIKGGKFNSEAFKGLSTDDKRKAIVDEMAKTGSAMSATAVNQMLIGGNPEEQMMAILQQFMTIVESGFAGLLRRFGQSDVADKIDKMRSDANLTNGTSNKIYSETGLKPNVSR